MVLDKYFLLSQAIFGLPLVLAWHDEQLATTPQA